MLTIVQHLLERPTNRTIGELAAAQRRCCATHRGGRGNAGVAVINPLHLGRRKSGHKSGIKSMSEAASGRFRRAARDDTVCCRCSRITEISAYFPNSIGESPGDSADYATNYAGFERITYTSAI